MDVKQKTTHDIKTWPNCWDATKRGEKPFEARKNDRFYQSGDIVKLRRWNPSVGRGCYEDQDGNRSNFPQEDGTLVFHIGWMLHGGQFGIEPGYCVFSLSTPTPTGKEKRDDDSD